MVSLIKYWCFLSDCCILCSAELWWLCRGDPTLCLQCQVWQIPHWLSLRCKHLCSHAARYPSNGNVGIRDCTNLHTVYVFSQLDCFHPSLIAHQNMAKALWNNMITPAAQKRDYFDYTEPFVCPTNTTFLYTNWQFVVFFTVTGWNSTASFIFQHFYVLYHVLKLFNINIHQCLCSLLCFYGARCYVAILGPRKLTFSLCACASITRVITLHSAIAHLDQVRA